MGHPTTVLPPINVALHPLLSLIVAPFGNTWSEDDSFVTGKPSDNFDVPFVETSLSSRFEIMLACD